LLSRSPCCVAAPWFHECDRVGSQARWTPDPDGAAAFYSALFGWEREAFGPMTMRRRPGYVGGEPSQPVARDVVAVMDPPTASVPARWGVDFWVADADVAAATAEREGGSVLAAPAEAGPFRTATLADPGGAAFSVSRLLARE
jgi:predicted enzyme related to lactoylglutathione lyase